MGENRTGKLGKRPMLTIRWKDLWRPRRAKAYSVSEQVTVRLVPNREDPLKPRVIVRKAQIDEPEHKVIGKHGLTATGEWVEVAEGMPYPESCILPVIIYEAKGFYPTMTAKDFRAGLDDMKSPN